MSDLAVDIAQWKECGDGLVIMRDWNVDVSNAEFWNWVQALGLHDLSVATLEVNEPPPATYQRGSKPIDTILATGAVRVAQGGYLPFGTGIGDHRPL